MLLVDMFLPQSFYIQVYGQFHTHLHACDIRGYVIFCYKLLLAVLLQNAFYGSDQFF